MHPTIRAKLMLPQAEAQLDKHSLERVLGQAASPKGQALSAWADGK
jgi:hypothetical protein